MALQHYISPKVWAATPQAMESESRLARGFLLQILEEGKVHPPGKGMGISPGRGMSILLL